MNEKTRLLMEIAASIQVAMNDVAETGRVAVEAEQAADEARMAADEAVDRHRLARVRLAELEASIAALSLPPVWPLGSDTSPEPTVAEAKAVEPAEKVPPWRDPDARYAERVRFYFYEHPDAAMTAVELAEETGIPAKNINQILSRGLRRPENPNGIFDKPDPSGSAYILASRSGDQHSAA